jgi:DNA-binding NtrC family response regulator
MKRLLLVEDDQKYAHEFADFFSLNFDITLLFSEKDFYDRFNPYSFDLVILDIRLNEKKEGLDILKYIKTENPYLPVVMITGYDSTDFYTEAISLGADAYLSKKSFNFSAIKKVLDTILEKSNLEKRISNLENRINKAEPKDIVGKSKKIQEVKEKIKMAAADGKMTVLVTGETGVGKELVARNIHQIGIRQKGPFVTVMIAGIPRDVLYSELFGHEKGAFTSAYDKRRGFIEEAHQGIIFLDEISELDMDAQVKLLRVLEYQTFQRLGSNKEIKVDVQFVAATNQKLEKLVDVEKFRDDLFFRLNTFEINIPPLRERIEDIPLLATHFLGSMRQEGRTFAGDFGSEIIDIFMNHPWPGNIRELKNIVESLGTYARFKNKEKIDKEFVSYLQGIVTKTSQQTKKNHLVITNYEKNLAVSELQMVDEGIKMYGRKKTRLAEKLGYNDRFIFLRRIKAAFEKFPGLQEQFPDVYRLFYG